MKKTVSLVLAAVLIISVFAGCVKKEAALTTGEIGVVKDEEFGNVYIELTIDEFNELGFTFDDSVDIAFDNGKTYEDIPYYSGYYVPVGEMLA